MSQTACNHAKGLCYDVDAAGHLTAVFGDQPDAPLPSMCAVETLDPREAR